MSILDDINSRSRAAKNLTFPTAREIKHNCPTNQAFDNHLGKCVNKSEIKDE